MKNTYFIYAVICPTRFQIVGCSCTKIDVWKISCIPAAGYMVWIYECRKYCVCSIKQHSCSRCVCSLSYVLSESVCHWVIALYSYAVIPINAVWIVNEAGTTLQISMRGRKTLIRLTLWWNWKTKVWKNVQLTECFRINRFKWEFDRKCLIITFQ